jgi:regulator of replication initiation timing
MKIWASFAVAGAALLLAGCATVSREQCEAGDWPAIGKAHALQGFPESRLQKVVEDCGRHSIAVDTDAYMQGWRMGVRAYCTPRRGFEDGRNGKRPSFSCPADLAVAYDDARRLGGRLKEAEDDVSLSESSLERTQREVDDLGERIAALDCVQEDRVARRACRLEREHLRDRRSSARFSLDSSRRDLRQAQRERDAVFEEVMAAYNRRFSARQ